MNLVHMDISLKIVQNYINEDNHRNEEKSSPPLQGEGRGGVIQQQTSPSPPPHS
jgi:hypothetical protein